VWLAGALTIVVVRLLAWRRIRTALRCSGDHLTAVLHFVTEAVFWFHPLVWWIGSRLSAERQRACDERAAGGADAARRAAAAAS
jgi:beta-lactamase regulating signal transducer with metallopeptidase domain